MLLSALASAGHTIMAQCPVVSELHCECILVTLLVMPLLCVQWRWVTGHMCVPAGADDSYVAANSAVWGTALSACPSNYLDPTQTPPEKFWCACMQSNLVIALPCLPLPCGLPIRTDCSLAASSCTGSS